MVKDQYCEVQERVRKACLRSGRDPKDVTLIAVSKTKPLEMLLEAYDAGARDFGENKVQEILEKYPEMPEDARFHMIGHLQRNKVRQVIDKVSLIHSVDSLRLARQIEEESAKAGRITPILLEVNVAREESKFGFFMEEVERAVDMAQCREIINKLPLGLNTKIGTEGTYLSGGEQQRIVLARAILKNAPIIVLDEATAFADPENEHLIQQALKELTKGKTVLMIAHRLSSITDADNILVIDKGKIAEQGTHANLLGKQGIYYHMWNEYQQSVRWTIGKEVSND